MSRRNVDVKFMLLVEDDNLGDQFFGPFATEKKAQQEGEKFERAGVDAWSVHELQPGSYAPEWRRIAREYATPPQNHIPASASDQEATS